MRPPDQLVYSRARVRQRYALLPLEGFPTSRLPSWPDAEVLVLAAPALGAQFVQYLINLPAGKRGEFAGDDRLETFYFVLSGTGTLGKGHNLAAGSFGLLPPGHATGIRAGDAMSLIVLRKAFERDHAIEIFQPYHGDESKVKAETWANNSHSRLQTLIPDDLQYDMAMNIFTFDPGHGLPYVETHVMEHGLLFLQGKGMYYLDGEWMEVQQDDFIWMGPYCPQSFYATGPTASRYLYYKNVNREIPL
jgi:(S)-ureidoglycine aminohydrolase